MGKGEKNIHLKWHAQLGLIKLSESEPFHFLSVSFFVCKTEKIHTLHTYSPLCLNGGKSDLQHTHTISLPHLISPNPPTHRGNSFLKFIFE